MLQLAVDGALVALAYYLAFQLRFDNGPKGYYALLRERTIWWVLVGSLPVLVLARVYERRWRYSGQRDYEAVMRAVVAIVLLTVVAVVGVIIAFVVLSSIVGIIFEIIKIAVIVALIAGVFWLVSRFRR